MIPTGVYLTENEPVDGQLPPIGSFVSRRAALFAVLRGARQDMGQTSPASLLGRSLRRVPALWMDEMVSRLLSLPIYQAHLDRVGQRDPLFFLSHRHYLARGFTLAQRAAAATSHYLGEAAVLTSDAASAIYQGPGMALWSAHHGDHSYEIRLTAGLDVAHEGAASLSLFCDETRVCVMSFSHLPRHLVDNGPVTHDLTSLITRKQLTRARDYQKPFFTAFDRSAPAHLVLAALEGIVLARGEAELYGLRAPAHPVYSDEIAAFMRPAYCEFWESLSGQVSSERAYVLPVPMHLRAIEDLQPDHRARAHARRGHADRVRAAARAAMASCLRNPRA